MHSLTAAPRGSSTTCAVALPTPESPTTTPSGGAGLGFNWNVSHGLSLNAYVATKIGNNPGRSANGNDADGEDSSTRGWFGMEWAF